MAVSSYEDSKKDAIMTPQSVENRPRLSELNYRVGDYTSFKNTMMYSIIGESYLTDWKVRLDTDFGIAIISLWAYLADILTFYQERIANEAYLRTASHRDNMIRMAAMLDYKLNPGVAATTHLALILEKDSKLNVPVGLKVQSVPGQDETPQKFETVESKEVFSSINEMYPQTLETQYVFKEQTQAVLKGIDTGLEEGDFILFIGEKLQEKHPHEEHWDLRKLNSVICDAENNTTIVGWEEGLGHKKVPFPPEKDEEIREDVKIYAMKQIAWPFGVDAPEYKLLPSNLICPECEVGYSPPFPSDWTGKNLPEDDENPNHIFLDKIYGDIEVGNWIALVTTKPPRYKPYYPGWKEAYKVLKVDNTVKINYTLNAKVTRLTVNGKKKRGKIWPEHIDYFPMQGTMILAQSAPLELAKVPIKDTLSKNVMVLEGYYPELKTEHVLCITGDLSDESKEVTTAVEIVEIEDVKPNIDSTLTIVTLKKDLENSYKLDSVKVYGNVVKATHGETIEKEILGNGDASSQFQEFTLKKSPTTYVPDASAPRGAVNTLEVRVNDILWKEVESLYGQKLTDRVYTTSLDDEGIMSVLFGDGITGSRIPTGRANVIAKYRQGLGEEGNVRANTLKTLLKKPVGLKSSTNPKEAEGGTDAESLKDARKNAPNTVRTFERAISLWDFEDLARDYTGIAKAKAVAIMSDEEEYIQLTITGENGDRIDTTSTIYWNFIDYLDLHRDRNHTIKVIPHSNKALEIKASIQVDSRYLEKKVLANSKAALLEYFDFENLELGQGIHISNIYGILQDVEGVVAVRIEYLRLRNGDDQVRDRIPPGDILEQISTDHIIICPDQIATLIAEDILIDTDFTEGGE